MITRENFVQNALRSYDNPRCRTLEQFENDVKQFSNLKKLLKQDKVDNNFVQLVLNNIVYLFNMFEPDTCTKMLFFKIRKEHWQKLKTYLIFLNKMPDNIDGTNLNDSDIKLCPKIAAVLRLV